VNVVEGGWPLPSEAATWIAANVVKVSSVAGNRVRNSPGIGARLERSLGEAFRRLGHAPAVGAEADERGLIA
jgi:hypothetical protein